MIYNQHKNVLDNAFLLVSYLVNAVKTKENKKMPQIALHLYILIQEPQIVLGLQIFYFLIQKCKLKNEVQNKLLKVQAYLFYNNYIWQQIGHKVILLSGEWIPKILGRENNWNFFLDKKSLSYLCQTNYI